VLGNDAAEQKAGPCPAAHKNGVCLEGTTMDLLSYVSRKWYSIGYAEPDALIYFPNVGAIPINSGGIGYAPTRTNALRGHYPFLATEYLYTNRAPTGLAAHFINFLKSDAVTDQLSGTLFIACSDLAGSKLSGACL
jgi:ABC-type phosphate transport system substrate-binding protein